MEWGLTTGLGLLVLAIWVYLVGAHGAFWRAREQDRGQPAALRVWPEVAVIVPARNEADCIGTSLPSLLGQDYHGRLGVFLVDDDSSDGTADIARRAASDGRHPLTIVTTAPLPPGWTGKLWALKCGIDATRELPQRPRYLLFTDADITHAADTVAWLVSHAERGGLVLASLMAKLRCESLAERSHVPAFVFFFQMLYPFAWVNQPRAATAAAAGGCILVNNDALSAAGGIESIRDALIDDCTLAQKMKSQGAIWLGLTERVHSIRAYPDWLTVRSMVTRSAYAQLRYSLLLLLATTAGLALTFLAAPALALFAHGLAQWSGIAAWVLMALAFQPMLRFYGLSPLWGVALPGIALLYMAYTVESAVHYLFGRGGAWKGRIQANVSAR